MPSDATAATGQTYLNRRSDKYLAKTRSEMSQENLIGKRNLRMRTLKDYEEQFEGGQPDTTTSPLFLRRFAKLKLPRSKIRLVLLICSIIFLGLFVVFRSN